MTLHLYWGSGSAPAWRTLLALEWKRIPYESHLLSFDKREHKSDEILRMNPRGKVPVLRDGDFALYESTAIVAYLERQFPDPPLFGRDAREAGTIWRIISECTSYLEPALDRVRRPIFSGKAKEQRADIDAALPLLHAELASLDAQLRDRSFLAGEAPTGAEVFAVPMIGMLERAGTRPLARELELSLWPIADRYPALSAWWDRVRALPGFDRTLPPHWKAG